MKKEPCPLQVYKIKQSGSFFLLPTSNISSFFIFSTAILFITTTSGVNKEEETRHADATKK